MKCKGRRRGVGECHGQEVAVGPQRGLSLCFGKGKVRGRPGTEFWSQSAALLPTPRTQKTVPACHRGSRSGRGSSTCAALQAPRAVLSPWTRRRLARTPRPPRPLRRSSFLSPDCALRSGLSAPGRVPLSWGAAPHPEQNSRCQFRHKNIKTISPKWKAGVSTWVAGCREGDTEPSKFPSTARAGDAGPEK